MSATSLVYTPIDELPKIREELRAGFRSGKLKSIAYRKKQLLAIAYLLKDNVRRFQLALNADLGRPPLETTTLDVNSTIHEAHFAYQNVEKWAKDEKAPFSLNFSAMRPVTRKEAKGVVCIIGPFNFPVWCLFCPLAGAIAAGNAAVLKCSEQTPATSALIAELVPKYLDRELFRVVNGAVPETTKLLELQWDHIFYTGSNRVGRIISLAAAKHLTPVSLELGGKSPVVIDPKCDVHTAARRILWGKSANCGQVCTAPDYILVPRDFQDTFIAALKEEYAKFYPGDSKQFESLGRLVSAQSFARVKNLLDNTKGTIVIGGETDESQKFIAPTVVRDVTGDDSLMSEEIFGPVLPLVPVKDVDEAIEFINSRDHPLALYVFSQDSKFKAKVFSSTQSGAAVANETILHAAVDGLPFGGTGPSGSGYHTGKHGFDTFTHLRASMDVPGWIDRIMGARFPPYTDKNLKFLQNVTGESLPPRDGKSGNKAKWLLFALAAAAASLLSTSRGRALIKG